MMSLNKVLVVLLCFLSAITAERSDSYLFPRYLQEKDCSFDQDLYWIGYVCGDPGPRLKEPDIVIQFPGNDPNSPRDDSPIVTCSNTSVTVAAGAELTELIFEEGQVLMFVDVREDGGCQDCNMLFRVINGTRTESDGTTVYETTRASAAGIGMFEELLSERGVDAPDINRFFTGISLEEGMECTYPANGGNRERSLEEKTIPLDLFESARPNSCNADWFQVLPDGRCDRTNCTVGFVGDSSDCFACGETCGDGCGLEGAFDLVGDFDEFNFDNGCCNHDYCYRSNLGRDECDSGFLADMFAACSAINSTALSFQGFINQETPPNILCPIVSAVYYALAIQFGQSSFDAAQADQADHDLTATCNQPRTPTAFPTRISTPPPTIRPTTSPPVPAPVPPPFPPFPPLG